MSAPTRKKRKTDDCANAFDDINVPHTSTTATAASEQQGDVRPGAGGGGTSTDQFVEGSIVRITLRNFLTYDFAVMTPGPNLNMLVGANGTGKSSIVCAICLGLAGKTTVMGRGDKVGLYVKRGCNKGSVKIELYKNGGNLVITREITVENNTSVWTLNGKHSNQKAVEEEVRALRIQVSNLCQFLPQEKVGEFAKMTKIELLEATEKSVGSPEMYQYHCELKNFRTKERDLENALKEKASFLERAKQRNERNKVDMNRYYEKKKHLALIQTLERKKVWLEYNKIRTELEDVKKERDEAKSQFSSLKQAQAPLVKKVQTIEKQLRPVEAQLQAKSADIKDASRKCKQKQDQLDRKHKEIDDIKQSLRLKQTEEEDRQKRLLNTRRLIEALRLELENVGEQPDLVPQIDAINAELRTIQEERSNIDGEKDGLSRRRANTQAEHKSLAKRLHDMNNMMNVKEESLRRRHKDTHSGIQWLRQNRDMFVGNVHEPMMLVINVKDSRFAKYVENHIAFNDLRAFVFQRKDDMEKFNAEVRDRLNLRVNTISAPAESVSGRPPSQPLESLKRFGFYSYLREMFDAPDEVMSYLCQQYRVHDVPVGDNKTKSMIKRVIEEPNMKILYTSDERYQVKRSFYSNKISTSNSSIHPSQYLSITVDAEEKSNVEKQLKTCEASVKEIDEQLKTLQQRASQLDHRDNELRAEKKRLSEMKGKKRQLEQKISTKEDSLKQMEQGSIDLKKAEAEINKKIAAVHAQKVAIASELIAQMKLKASLGMDKVYLALETVGLSAEKTKLEDDLKSSAAELRGLDQACSNLDQRKKALTESLRAQMGKFREICNLAGGEDVINNLATSLSHLPNNVDEIDVMLNEERSRAECFTGLNENVVEEYNRSEQEIKNLEKEVGEKTTQLDVYRQNISQAKERWLNPLKQLVDIINQKFSDFFRAMQCVGEVDLHYENEEEYDKYGIRIRVKFHSSTQLHELTPHHQSGGERSVSTMLYLMALQELNRCPFRVVDEINQGMDPINERRVFDIVVRTACKQSTSQYFFITPKLLQNLQYGEEMVVLLVNNGPDILVSNEFDERAFIRRRGRFGPKPKA